MPTLLRISTILPPDAEQRHAAQAWQGKGAAVDIRNRFIDRPGGARAEFRKF